MANEETKTIRPASDVELAFIGRVFAVRGGQRIADTFTYAKSFGVSANWFSDPRCRAVWGGAEKLFASSTDFQNATVTDVRRAAKSFVKEHKKADEELDGVEIPSDFFYEIAGKLVADADGIDGYVANLRALHVSREFREACAEVNEQMETGSDVISTVASFQSRVSAILTNASPASMVSVADHVREIEKANADVYHHVQELGELGYVNGWTMPWEPLTRAIHGFKPGLHIVAARPSVGKTSYALMLVRYWLEHGIRVCFNTLDMAPSELLVRLMAQISNVPTSKTAFGTADKEMLSRVTAAGDKLRKWEESGLLTVYNEFDVDRLKAQVQILHDQGKVDVLVIDYIQKLGFSGCERLGEYATVTRCCKTLHQIMLQLGMPVVPLAQLNRASTKDGGREPEMSDLRSSGQLEQDAFTITILHRDESVKKTWEQNPPTQFFPEEDVEGSGGRVDLRAIDPVWVILAKAQNGTPGVKLPFVQFKDRFSWYLGDAKADVPADKFASLHDDWRHDPIEKTLLDNNALISTENEQAVFRANYNIGRKRRGLPPLPNPNGVPDPVVDDAPAKVDTEEPQAKTTESTGGHGGTKIVYELDAPFA